MTMRRALVVDDSKLARVALKKQLEEYNLSVELADSGEEALDFLKRDKVDVIFMDHIMPGMDGLTAVRALKSNPATATIPVMMYTSKEGEVYVSQARALGAVDVLPKQVQPGVLFGMLLKLGLVRDRRQAANDDPDAADDGAPSNGRDDEDDTPPGMHMPALMARILEDQRSAMRSDLMSSQRSFARQVANEVWERQRTDIEEIRHDLENYRPTLFLPVAAGGLAVAAVFFATLFFAGLDDRGNPPPEPVSPGPAVTVAEPAAAAETEVAAEDPAPAADAAELLQAVGWALTESGSVEFGEQPFDEARGLQLEGLLDRLANAGFLGTVRMESHLGEFCLAVDANGIYRLADPETPVAACSLIGHPLDGSESVAERRTPAFAAILDDARSAYGDRIDIELVANDRAGSMPLTPYPAEPGRAGAWNAIAARNHRVDYTLIPR